MLPNATTAMFIENKFIQANLHSKGHVYNFLRSYTRLFLFGCLLETKYCIFLEILIQNVYGLRHSYTRHKFWIGSQKLSCIEPWKFFWMGYCLVFILANFTGVHIYKTGCNFKLSFPCIILCLVEQIHDCKTPSSSLKYFD